MAITSASAVALDLLDDSDGLWLHSQFASGVNLACRDYLVFVGTDPHGGACAIQVDAADLEMLRSSLHWRWNGRGLVGPEQRVVELARNAVRYTAQPPTVPGLSAGDPGRLARARAAAGGFSWFDSGLGLEVGLPRLRAAIAALLGGGDAGAIRSVIGLGVGLTPSGDDALVGALCLFAAAGIPSSEAGRHLDSCLSADGVGSTTAVSANYLRLALEGAFSTPLRCLVTALADGVPDASLMDAVRGLAAIGATSGMDAAVGTQVAWEQLVTAATRHP